MLNTDVLLPPQKHLHIPSGQDFASRAQGASTFSAIKMRLVEYCVVSITIRSVNGLDCQSVKSPSLIETTRWPSLQNGRKILSLPFSRGTFTRTESDMQPQADHSKDETTVYSSEEFGLASEYVMVDDVDPGSCWALESRKQDAASELFKKPFNKLHFSREYEILALKVPAEECRNVADSLRGHLLNWPRISNVARVAGDDVDNNMKALMGSGKGQEESIIDSLRNAVYGNKKTSGSLSERIRLVETFRERRCRNFPTLEKISRTKLTSLKRQWKDGDNARKHAKNKAYTIAVAESKITSTSDKETEASYLKMDFSIKKWVGPTRLLLLDSKHAGKSVSDLPMAVQVLLSETTARSRRRSKREIVPCKLTLLYEYWSLEEILEELLPRVPISSIYKTVGQIAQLNLEQKLLPFKYLLAKVIYDKLRPKIQTVVIERDSRQNQFGALQLEVLAGNHSLVTRVIEHGIQFHINLGTVYWNSTLASERHRLVESFDEKDVICDVFAGVGPLSMAAAKKVQRVFANDLNPNALKYLAKNVTDNKLQGKVEVYNLDGHEFIQKLLGFAKPVHMTKVVMDLPANAEIFLGSVYSMVS